MTKSRAGEDMQIITVHADIYATGGWAELQSVYYILCYLLPFPWY
jgi:hypothetical protein